MSGLWLGLSALPYLALAGADAWIHERGRRVPRLEQWVHGGLALTMTLFLAAVLLGRTYVAVGALAGFLGLLAWDELAFHRAIARPEKRLHVLSWLALAGFVGIWLLAGAR
jgi:hypothetical protein